jgi:hypothetical protein
VYGENPRLRLFSGAIANRGFSHVVPEAVQDFTVCTHPIIIPPKIVFIIYKLLNSLCNGYGF